ncbi:hypothetical protein DP73_11630 [Desulfosporosinus sp. HMP52]|nr:hypothetical protein DP73_11630 [Desulfosporosinus sp. HMP52]
MSQKWDNSNSRIEPEDAAEPADLIIFAVKFNGLKDAIQAVRNQVGEHTIILSALNGITIV